MLGQLPFPPVPLPSSKKEHALASLFVQDE